ncbi:MAG: single-stranded DNA-binding protein [Synergistaceae bacterium]|nr:single-stranded DNA-binding protein [Synergistaceae bacterium]
MISATIFGRLTKEPEVRVTPGGTQLCEISIAVNHGKDAQGQDLATFVNCTAFGKTIETIQKYCHKGLRVCVAVSDLRLRRYTSQNGTPGASLEGAISRIDIVDWPDQQSVQAPQGAQSGGYGYPPGYPAPAPASAPAGGYQNYPAYPNAGAAVPTPPAQYSAPAAAPPIQGAPTTGGWTPPGGSTDFPFGANVR